MILQNGGHGHSHGPSIVTARLHRSSGDANVHLEDSHDDVMTMMMTNDDNINVKAAFIHVIGDLLQSLGVLTAAYIIFYKVRWSTSQLLTVTSLHLSHCMFSFSRLRTSFCTHTCPLN